MSTANKLKIAGKTNRQRTEWLPARHGTQDRIPDPLSHRSRATEPAFIWKDTNYDYCHGVCLGLIFFLWCFVVLLFWFFGWCPRRPKCHELLPQTFLQAVKTAARICEIHSSAAERSLMYIFNFSNNLPERRANVSDIQNCILWLVACCSIVVICWTLYDGDTLTHSLTLTCSQLQQQ